MKCEGYIKRGSIFTLGPRTWRQCENESTVMIKFEQEWEGKIEPVKTLPACNDCWKRIIDSDKIRIISVEPILNSMAKVPFIEKDVKEYLDNAIRRWRKMRDSKHHDSDIASFYIDAYQSVRVSLFGELLEKEKIEEGDG